MPTKRPLTRLRDIVDNIEAVLGYTKEMDFASFLESRLVRDGSERCPARISEAAVKLGQLAEELFPAHGWHDIRGFGNVLRHEYQDVLDDLTWVIVSVHLPALLADIKPFLAKYPEDQETL